MALFHLNSLRTKLALSYVLAVGLVGILCSIIGIATINRGIINQAQNRVSADLNSAGEIYDQFANQVLNVCRFTATRFFLKKALLEKKNLDMIQELERVLKTENLDFLSVVDTNGVVLARGTNKDNFNDTVYNPLIEHTIKTKSPTYATEILTAEGLYKENPVLKKKAEIKIL
ncbi:MAG: hypothetical protein ABIL07_05825, partial [candidate division WOR-3 bacterium]